MLLLAEPPGPRLPGPRFTAQPFQPVQIQTLPTKPVVPAIQTLPTHPSQTPAGCVWVSLSGCPEGR